MKLNLIWLPGTEEKIAGRGKKQPAKVRRVECA